VAHTLYAVSVRFFTVRCPLEVDLISPPDPHAGALILSAKETSVEVSVNGALCVVGW